MSVATQNKAVVLVAIISVAVLEGIAMIKGIDGSFFGLTVAAISGLAGYHGRDLVNKQPQLPLQ